MDDEQHRVTITVPANATVVPQQVDGPMVEVRWDGRTVTMFIIDLQQRGQIVDAAAA